MSASTTTTTTDTTTTDTTTTDTTTTPTITLVSSDGVYTAEAGNGHESNLTLSAAPSYVFWYVQGPDDSAPVLRYQDTSGSLTSQLGYSFPSGVSGDYVISVSGTSASGGSAIIASYTVTVSLPSSTPQPTDNTPDCSYCTEGCSACQTSTTTPAPVHTQSISAISSSATGGETMTFTVNTSVACSHIDWYVCRPGQAVGKDIFGGDYIKTSSGDGTATTATMSWTFPTTAGTYTIEAYVNYPGGDRYYETYTVTVE